MRSHVAPAAIRSDPLPPLGLLASQFVRCDSALTLQDHDAARFSTTKQLSHRPRHCHGLLSWSSTPCCDTASVLGPYVQMAGVCDSTLPKCTISERAPGAHDMRRSPHCHSGGRTSEWRSDSTAAVSGEEGREWVLVLLCSRGSQLSVLHTPTNAESK